MNLMSVNKYACHIASMNHTAIMLNGHIYPRPLYICVKTHATVMSTSHVVAMYVPAINMPLKWYTGGSCLNWIFWEHENMSGLFTLNYTRKRKNIWQKIQAKWESGLTAEQLKWDPPVYISTTTNVTRSTGIHTVHIIGICPRTNMPAALHIYVPLYILL